jgi:hypothetical protein
MSSSIRNVKFYPKKVVPLNTKWNIGDMELKLMHSGHVVGIMLSPFYITHVHSVRGTVKPRANLGIQKKAGIELWP